MKAIYIDEANKQVYIGTHTGGLSILHRRSGQIETYNRNSREKNIYAIEPTETGDFWMSGMSSDKRVVTLSGEAYFEVAPDKNRPFYVETEEVKIRVLGTVFDVNTHYTRGVRTVLVEGAVALEWGDQKEIRMKPGELADFDRTTTEVTLKEVDVTSYISWKEGYFVFEDEPLEEIMHTLSLWYDKEFLFVGKRSRTLHFSGHIKRYERIETILSAITDVTGVEFRMNGQIILIR